MLTSFETVYLASLAIVLKTERVVNHYLKRQIKQYSKQYQSEHSGRLITIGVQRLVNT